MTRTSRQIRREFLEFFRQRGHALVPSSPLLPADDPTLLFANAGMNQFKDVFLGTGTRPYTRAANSQKCIRAGGKHNDLEDVGHDTYHHTFFEMLGNWSFGDYFKAEAIAWAWELLTKVWGLPKERLWATVFGGAAPGDSPEEVELWGKLSAAGIGPDLEAGELWRKTAGLPNERVLAGSVHDNFWAPGDTGPCGPCTEIHYDFGRRACDGSGHAGTGCAVNMSHCARFIEIWNLVFIQFNRDESGKLWPLPSRHVDTGMGFERICRVLQGKDSNYDTDVFAPLIQWLEERSGLRYGVTPNRAANAAAVASGAPVAPDTDVAFRVVADHARACSFAIADGVLPSNEGRGYVIRRILRRAARFGRKLNLHEPFLFGLVDVLVEQLGDVFPELKVRRDQVFAQIQSEEVSFNKTLDRGLELFERQAERMAQAGRKELGGELAFELYATYGFPVDLTQLMAAERGLTVDMAGYQQEMQRHRKISRTDRFQVGDISAYAPRAATTFVGYEKPRTEARVIRTTRLEKDKDGKLSVTGTSLNKDNEGIVFLDQTPFYAEAGGQVGDTGFIRQDSGEFMVTDTREEVLSPTFKSYCHYGKVIKGKIETHVSTVRAAGQPDSGGGWPPPGTSGRAIAEVDEKRRLDIRRNHTATHLLNWALRQVLGGGVEQAGSVVEPARLRFDFTYGQALTDEQLVQVERLVNQRVLADEPVYPKEMPQAEAERIPGVRKVFTEKYRNSVRVISIGAPVGSTGVPPVAGKDTAETAVLPSIEFCGGTHLDRTGQAGLFKIISQESVARGVRRITAVTGQGAVDYVGQLDAAVRSASGLLRVNLEGLAERVAALQAEVKQLRRQRSAGGLGELTGAVAAGEKIGGVTVIVQELQLESVEEMRNVVDQLRQKAGGPSAVMVGSRQGGKVTLVAGVSEDVVKAKSIRAGDWAKAAAAVVGGSGGGKPTMAQAGGKDPDRLPEALEAAAEWIRSKLGA